MAEAEQIENPNTEGESGDTEAQAFTKDDVDKLIAEATASIKKEYANTQSGLQKRINELASALEQKENEGKSIEEQNLARIEKLEQERQRERVERLRVQHARAAGLDPEDDVLIVGTDEESIIAQVEAIKARDKRRDAERNREFDRRNGRRIETSKEADSISVDDLERMSPSEEDSFARTNPKLYSQLLQKQIDKQRS